VRAVSLLSELRYCYPVITVFSGSEGDNPFYGGLGRAVHGLDGAAAFRGCSCTPESVNGG
jgi:hypothetical protein